MSTNLPSFSPGDTGSMKNAHAALAMIFLFTVMIVFVNIGAFSSRASVVNPSGALIAVGGSFRGMISSPRKKKIAYTITVTKDGPFLDGAIVLGYAALKVHDAKQGFHSIYDADLVAFVTSRVITARPILASHGWKILEKNIPVSLEEIENKHYVDKVSQCTHVYICLLLLLCLCLSLALFQMKESGCCGADEFIKLYAYNLTEYHRVVHLDMDSIIYKNMVFRNLCT